MYIYIGVTCRGERGAGERCVLVLRRRRRRRRRRREGEQGGRASRGGARVLRERRKHRKWRKQVSGQTTRRETERERERDRDSDRDRDRERPNVETADVHLEHRFPVSATVVNSWRRHKFSKVLNRMPLYGQCTRKLTF